MSSCLGKMLCQYGRLFPLAAVRLSPERVGWWEGGTRTRVLLALAGRGEGTPRSRVAPAGSRIRSSSPAPGHGLVGAAPPLGSPRRGAGCRRAPHGGGTEAALRGSSDSPPAL